MTIVIKVNIKEAWSSWEAWHGLHGAKEGIEEACTDRSSNVTNRNGEASWNTLEICVMRERVLSLGHTDGQITKALSSVGLNLLFGEIAELYAVCAVNFLTNMFNLCFNGLVEGIQKLEFLFAITSGNKGLTQFNSASTALGPVVTSDSVVCARVKRQFADEL
jgi:hypothetical protein